MATRTDEHGVLGLVLTQADDGAAWKHLFGGDERLRICVKCQRTHTVNDSIAALFEMVTCGVPPATAPAAPPAPSEHPYTTRPAPANYIQPGRELDEFRAKLQHDQQAALAPPAGPSACPCALVLRGMRAAPFGEFGGFHPRLYAPLKALGGGRSGTTFLAAFRGPPPIGAGERQLRKVAVKRFEHGFPPADFDAELGALEQLRRLRVFGVASLWDQLDAAASLAMTHFDAPSIEDVLRDGYVFSDDEVASFLEQMALIFHHVHTSARLLHCDVSTTNVLVKQRGKLKPPRFMLIDFGNAMQLPGADVDKDLKIRTETSAHVSRIAPIDLMRGFALPASDLYSVGLVAVQMLLGIRSDDPAAKKLDALCARNLNVASPRDERFTGIGRELQAILYELLRTHSDDRTQSAGELWEAVRRLIPTNQDFLDADDPHPVRLQVESLREGLLRGGGPLPSSSSAALASTSSAAPSSSPSASASAAPSSASSAISMALDIAPEEADPHGAFEVSRSLIGGVEALGLAPPELNVRRGSTIIDTKLPKHLAAILHSKLRKERVAASLAACGFTKIAIEGHGETHFRGKDNGDGRSRPTWWGGAFVPSAFVRPCKEAEEFTVLTGSEFWAQSLESWKTPAAEVARGRRYFTALSALNAESLRSAVVTLKAADGMCSVDPTLASEAIMGQLRGYYLDCGVDSHFISMYTRQQLAAFYAERTGKKPPNFKRLLKPDLIMTVLELILPDVAEPKAAPPTSSSKPEPSEQQQRRPKQGPAAASPKPQPAELEVTPEDIRNPERRRKDSLLAQLVSNAAIVLHDTLKLHDYTCRVLEQGLVEYNSRGVTCVVSGAAWAKAVLRKSGKTRMPRAAVALADLYPAAGGGPIPLRSLCMDLARETAAQQGGAEPDVAMKEAEEEAEDIDTGPIGKLFDDFKEDIEETGKDLTLTTERDNVLEQMAALTLQEKSWRQELLERLRKAVGKPIRTLADMCDEESMHTDCAIDELVPAGSMLGVLSHAVWRGAISEPALKEAVESYLRTRDGELLKKLDVLGPQARRLLADLAIPGPPQASTRNYVAEVLRLTAGKKGHAALFDDAAVIVLTHMLPLDIHVVYRDGEGKLAIKSVAGIAPTTLELRQLVIMGLEGKGKGRAQHMLLRPASSDTRPEDETVSESTFDSQVQPRSVHGFSVQWNIHGGQVPDNSDPDDPAVLETRLSRDESEYEWVRTSRRTREERVVATQPAPRKRAKKAGREPRALDAILHEIQELLDDRIRGQEKVFRLLCEAERVMLSTITPKANEVRVYDDNAEAVRENLESHLARSGTSLSSLTLLRIFLVGPTKAGKSTFLSSLIYEGLLNPDKYKRLTDMLRDYLTAEVPWDPQEHDFFGFLNGMSMPDDLVQKIKVLADAGQRAKAAAVGGVLSDADTSFVRGLIAKLVDRVGPRDVFDAKFIRGTILPALDVNATTSVPVVVKFAPFPYVLVAFITEDEHNTCKREALEALERLTEQVAYDSESGFDEDADKEKVLHALAMVGKEGLVNLEGRPYADLTPADFEFDEDILQMRQLRGRTLIYVPAMADRDEAMFAIQKLLGLFTANGIHGCWGLVKSVEFGVPSGACDGVIFWDCVGSSRIDTVRKAAAAVHSGMGSEVDVLLHILTHSNTPSEVYADLTEPIRSLILEPDKHAVILAYDAYRGIDLKDMTSARVQTNQREVEGRARNTEWVPTIEEHIPKIKAKDPEHTATATRGRIDLKKIKERVSFVPFCAAPSYFKARVRAPGSEESEKKPELDAMRQKLRELREEIVKKRLQDRFAQEIHEAVLHSFRLLYDSMTLQMQPLSEQERSRIDEEIRQAEKHLRRKVQALKSLGYQELYDKLKLCEEHIRSRVLGAYSSLDVCDRKFFDRMKNSTKFNQLKAPFLERNSRRLRQLLNSSTKEDEPLFKHLFGDFLKTLPTVLKDQLLTTYGQVLVKGTAKDPISVKELLVKQRLMLQGLVFKGRDGDSRRVVDMSTGILKRANKSLQEAISRYFDVELVAKLREFIRTGLKDAFLGTINTELDYYLRLAMRKRRTNAERFDLLLDTMAKEWQDTGNTGYEQTIINVCDSVEAAIAKEFERFRKNIPDGFREIILRAADELAGVRSNPSSAAGMPEGRRRALAQQWDVLLANVRLVFETAEQHGLVGRDDDVYGAYVEFRAECTL